MIHLELTGEEAALLRNMIGLRVDAVQNELVHTDDRALKAEIARDLDRLELLRKRLTQAAA